MDLHHLAHHTDRSGRYGRFAKKIRLRIAFGIAAAGAAVGIYCLIPFSTLERSPAKSAQLLWDHWYTVNVGGVHYAYYQDKLEKRGDQLFFQNRFWKNEEGYLNEEQLGALAKDTEELNPLFFNFHSTYRSNETTIDGNVQDGSKLTVKIVRNGQELPVIRKHVPKRVFFSSFFPVWVGRKLKSLKPGQSASFQSILEDSKDASYSTLSGLIRLEKPDDLAKKENSFKVTVDFQSQKSVWYFDTDGAPIRTLISSGKTVIERTTEEKAKSFLDSTKLTGTSSE